MVVLIAALYVQTNGCYFGLEGVDPWDEARDARLYDGPWPVVAHPPCERWSIMGICRGYYDGKDGGCFESALANVRRCGGILEHPAHTLAWRTFGLPVPSGVGWVRSMFSSGWACEVDQRHYGHRVRKPTWLFYVGDDPPPVMIWGRGAASSQSVRSMGRRSDGTSRSNGTPIQFRDLLISIAETANRQAVAA